MLSQFRALSPFVNVIFDLKAGVRKERVVVVSLASILFPPGRRLLGERPALEDTRLWERGGLAAPGTAARFLRAPCALPVSPPPAALRAAQPVGSFPQNHVSSKCQKCPAGFTSPQSPPSLSSPGSHHCFFSTDNAKRPRFCLAPRLYISPLFLSFSLSLSSQIRHNPNYFQGFGHLGYSSGGYQEWGLERPNPSRRGVPAL